jgi:hypothetical protein
MSRTSVVYSLAFVLISCAKPKHEEPSAAAQDPKAEPLTVTTASLQAPAVAREAAAAAPTPAPAGSAAPAEVSARCRDACASVQKLGCKHAAECEVSCREMSAVPRCQPEIGAFFGCLATQSADHWECLEDGTGAIRDGFCEREQARFAACLEKNDVQ